jgi:tetratricopeptide (TPR) repeat protein
MINLVQVMALAAVLCLTGGPAYAQGAGIEWETLIEEVRTLYRAGRYDRAIMIAKKALEVAEKRVGLNHPDVATSLNHLAKSHQAQGQYTQAEPLFKRALDILEKTLGPDHPDVATTLNNLADFYREQGQYARPSRSTNVR